MDKSSATDAADTLASNLQTLARTGGLRAWRLRGRELLPVVQDGMGTTLQSRPDLVELEDGATVRKCPRTAAELIHARQTVLPKRLLAPGPDACQLHALLGAEAAAPDHGQLLPWRFVIVPRSERASLADVFAQALRERDASATPKQLDQARDKAHRAPLLLLVVVNGQCGDPAVVLAERILSAGCAVQNMLLMATAMGFGSGLTSGKALGSTALHQRFGLHAGELATCFMSVGTVAARRPARAPDCCRLLQHTRTCANFAPLTRETL